MSLGSETYWPKATKTLIIFFTSTQAPPSLILIVYHIKQNKRSKDRLHIVFGSQVIAKPPSEPPDWCDKTN